MRFVPRGAGPGCAARDPGLPALGSALGRPCPATAARSLLAAVTLFRARVRCPRLPRRGFQVPPARAGARPRCAAAGAHRGPSVPREPSSSLSGLGPGTRAAVCTFPERREPALGPSEFLNPQRRLLFPLMAPGAVPERLAPHWSGFPGELFALCRRWEIHAPVSAAPQPPFPPHAQDLSRTAPRSARVTPGA